MALTKRQRLKLRNDGTVDTAFTVERDMIEYADIATDYETRVANMKPSPTAVERVEDRSICGKVFDLNPDENGGKRLRRLVTGIAPVHFADKEDGGRMKEIDPRWVETDTHFVVRRAAYTLRVEKARGIGYRFAIDGEHTTRNLLRIGSTPARDFLNTTPVIVENRLYWREVVTGVDIYLEARADGGEFFKVIKTKTAPRRFRWRITRPLISNKIQFSAWHGAQDNMFRDHPDREFRREIEVFTEEYNRVETDRVRYEEVEGINPRSATRHGENRELTWEDGESDWQYPLNIDQPDVDVSITADGDDGFYYDPEPGSGSEAWNNNNGTGLYTIGHVDSGNYLYHPGYRFVSLSIDNGATVPAATLEVEGRHSLTGTPQFNVNAQDADDADAWATGSNPKDQTTTPESDVVMTFNATDTRQSADVAAQVEHVVGRAGWASGNAIRFGLVVANTTGTHSILAKDYNTSGYGDPASLTVTWEAGASGSSDLERGIGRGVMRGVGRGT